ncbi:hypothetical protein SR39_18225 [Methylobacterium radiotolerans]|jgi:hypothetical protein|nr:hypothetical protein SR39_18225 [Methylobacterium radiotolerans]
MFGVQIMFVNHLEEIQPPRSLDNVLRGVSADAVASQRPEEPGVNSHGIFFTLDEYDYATHDLDDEERFHVMGRNAMIIGSLVLNQRPDLAEAVCSQGMGVDDLGDMQVMIIHANSAEFAKRSIPRAEVYKQGARATIAYFDGALS